MCLRVKGSRDNHAVYDIDFADSLNGVAVGVDALLITTDGGATWENRVDYVNYSPNQFNLYLPYFAQILDWNTIEFVWFSTTDFDSDDEITYNIYVAEDYNFDNIIASAEGLSDTTITLYDLPLEAWTEYWWRVKAFDSAGLGTWCKDPRKFIINELSIEDNNLSEIPTKAVLEQNYPNPFNPTTTIAFTIPNVETEHATSLQIYDISGNLIKTLVDAPLAAGYHTVSWNGVNENGKQVASGIYFYQLEINEKLIETKQMVLLK